MRAHGVIGQLQRRREIVHRLVSSAQELENLSPGALEDSFTPTGMLHNRSIRARRNKSKRALTISVRVRASSFCRAHCEKGEDHDVLDHVNEEGPGGTAR